MTPPEMETHLAAEADAAAKWLWSHVRSLAENGVPPEWSPEDCSAMIRIMDTSGEDWSLTTYYSKDEATWDKAMRALRARMG